MRLEHLDGQESSRAVGAAVVRAAGVGGVVIELGPADGPPVVRLTMSPTEAIRLAATVQAVAQGGGETVLIVED
jgi:hypothetical protein